MYVTEHNTIYLLKWKAILFYRFFTNWKYTYFSWNNKFGKNKQDSFFKIKISVTEYCLVLPFPCMFPIPFVVQLWMTNADDWEGGGTNVDINIATKYALLHKIKP
jgi:hypothetical protein